MKIKDRVISLEYAKKLKLLGVEQASIFYWMEKIDIFNDDKNQEQIFELESFINKDCYSFTPSHMWAAFNSSDLGIMLPDRISYKGISFLKICMAKDYDKIYTISCDLIIDDLHAEKYSLFYDKNESDCRAKMLIFLLEKDIISIEEVNNRLKGENAS